MLRGSEIGASLVLPPWVVALSSFGEVGELHGQVRVAPPAGASRASKKPWRGPRLSPPHPVYAFRCLCRRAAGPSTWK